MPISTLSPKSIHSALRRSFVQMWKGLKFDFDGVERLADVNIGDASGGTRDEVDDGPANRRRIRLLNRRHDRSFSSLRFERRRGNASVFLTGSTKFPRMFHGRFKSVIIVIIWASQIHIRMKGRAPKAFFVVIQNSVAALVIHRPRLELKVMEWQKECISYMFAKRNKARHWPISPCILSIFIGKTNSSKAERHQMQRAASEKDPP